MAEHAPSKGKGRLLDDTLCSGISPCDLSPSLRRQTGRPIDQPKPVSNSKTPPTLLAAVLLAVKMFITHRMSPVPGSTCHATKCLSLSLAPLRSPLFVCLRVCVWHHIGCVCVHVSVHCWLSQRSSSHSLGSECSVMEICLSAECLGDSFPLLSSVTNGGQAAVNQPPSLPVFTELPCAPPAVAEALQTLFTLSRSLVYCFLVDAPSPGSSC